MRCARRRCWIRLPEDDRSRRSIPAFARSRCSWRQRCVAFARACVRLISLGSRPRRSSAAPALEWPGRRGGAVTDVPTRSPDIGGRTSAWGMGNPRRSESSRSGHRSSRTSLSTRRRRSRRAVSAVMASPSAGSCRRRPRRSLPGGPRSRRPSPAGDSVMHVSNLASRAGRMTMRIVAAPAPHVDGRIGLNGAGAHAHGYRERSPDAGSAAVDGENHRGPVPLKAGPRCALGECGLLALRLRHLNVAAVNNLRIAVRVSRE